MSCPDGVPLPWWRTTATGGHVSPGLPLVERINFEFPPQGQTGARFPERSVEGNGAGRTANLGLL